MRWLWAHRSVLAALAGLGGLWVMDVANAVPVLSNGFWQVSVEGVSFRTFGGYWRFSLSDSDRT